MFCIVLLSCAKFHCAHLFLKYTERERESASYIDRERGAGWQENQVGSC